MPTKKKTPAAKKPVVKVKAKPKAKAKTRTRRAKKNNVAVASHSGLPPELEAQLRAAGMTPLTLDPSQLGGGLQALLASIMGDVPKNDEHVKHEVELWPHFESTLNKLFMPTFTDLLTDFSAEKVMGTQIALMMLSHKMGNILRSVYDMPGQLISFELQNHGPSLDKKFMEKPEIDAFGNDFMIKLKQTEVKKGEGEFIQKAAKGQKIPPV